MDEARDQEGRRKQKQLSARGRIIAGDNLFLEIEAVYLAEKPAAERPGTVVLARDGQDSLGHRTGTSFVHGGPAICSLDEDVAFSILFRAAKRLGSAVSHIFQH